MFHLGFEAVLYRNAGDPDAPDWQPMPNVRDATLRSEFGEADVTTRGDNGFEVVVPALQKTAVECEQVDDTTDPDMIALRNAHFTRQPIEILALDAPLSESGAWGVRAFMSVFKFERNESLPEANLISVAMKPTRAPGWPPTLVVVP